MTPPPADAPAIDLRRAPLAAVRAVDLRAPDRDLWADERATWDRFVASWAARAPVGDELGEFSYRAALRLARALKPVYEVRLVAR